MGLGPGDCVWRSKAGGNYDEAAAAALGTKEEQDKAKAGMEKERM